jgi:hypothetical protein
MVADQDIEDLWWFWKLLMLANAGVLFCNLLVWVAWVLSRYAASGFGAQPEAIFPKKLMWKATVYFARLSRSALGRSTRGFTWKAVCTNGVGLGVRNVVVALLSVALGCLHIFCSLVCMATMPFVFILIAVGFLMVANLFLLLTGVHALLLEQGQRRAAGLLGDSLEPAADGADPDAGAGPAVMPSASAAVPSAVPSAVAAVQSTCAGGDPPGAPSGPTAGGMPEASRARGPEAGARIAVPAPADQATPPARIVYTRRKRGARADSPAKKGGASKRRNSAQLFEGSPEVSPAKRGGYRRASTPSRGVCAEPAEAMVTH